MSTIYTPSNFFESTKSLFFFSFLLTSPLKSNRWDLIFMITYCDFKKTEILFKIFSRYLSKYVTISEKKSSATSFILWLHVAEFVHFYSKKFVVPSDKIKLWQNKEGQIFVWDAPKMVFFLKLADENKTPFLVHPKQIVLVPSYFVRDLVSIQHEVLCRWSRYCWKFFCSEIEKGFSWLW